MSPPIDVVIITGSSGYIGSSVVGALAERYRVVGFDRESKPHPPPEAECVCVDVTSGESVKHAFDRVRTAFGHRIASVVHLAAYFDLSGEPDPRYQSVTVEGTERLLKALQNFEVEQFVFMSTMLVHAPPGIGQVIDESAAFDARYPYRASKIETEKSIAAERGGIPTVVLRPAGVYDDGGHSTFLAHQVARIFERRMTSRVYPGDLRTGQPFLHLDDLLDAIVRAIDRRHSLPPQTEVLLAESDVLGYGELQDLIAMELHGERWDTRRVPKPLAKTGAWLQDEVLGEDPFIRPWMVEIADDHYAVDTGRAKQLLGWAPRHSLRQTLPVMLQGLKDDPPAWYRSNRLNPSRVAASKLVPAADHATSSTEERPMSTHSQHAPPSGMSMSMNGMDHGAHAEHMKQAHLGTLWVHFVTIGLGLWLASSPFVFGAFSPDVSEGVLQVTAERGLADPVQRSQWLALSDIASGLAIALFAVLSLSRRMGWAQWASATVGVWLLFAPLVFWAPSAATYTNGTLVGALVIAFALLVPMMPGMGHAGMMDPSDRPIGWSYSPSTYLQRLPIIALGFFGLLIARWLTAYQFGHVDGVWEPFFSAPGGGGENGTEYIITSDISKAWPIPDAGLGAVSYVFEVLMGVMGGSRRWRTMPWMVAAFGIVVVPLGVISIYFIIIQPIMIGTWCTLCLLTALLMLIMIPYSLDELVAMGQFLVHNHRRGKPFWRAFLRGDAEPAAGKDEQPGFGNGIGPAFGAAIRGVTLPWTLALSAVLGAMLMFTRILFDTEPPMANVDHFIGALVVTVSVIATAEVARAVRFVNVLLGLALIVAPWVVDGAATFGALASALTGLLLIGLSLPRGNRSRDQYGSWERFIV